MENTNTKNIVLTDAERKLINNFDEGTRGGNFGDVKVKSYLGTTRKYVVLNRAKRRYRLANIGSIYFVPRENRWYFDAINGETYRILEPVDGIESLFELEFKRKDV